MKHSDATFAVTPAFSNSNYDDLFAATDACFKMYMIAVNPTYNPEGKNLKEITEMINYVYSIVLPKINSELMEMGIRRSIFRNVEKTQWSNEKHANRI